MYHLYIANKNYSSWSLRPWVLMQELEIPFIENLISFESTSNWESFRKFSPSGTVPCLHDKNRVIWDSLAIVEYLAEKHKKVWPKKREARAWARSASAEMHSGFSALRNFCSMNCGIRVRLNSMDPLLQNNLNRIDELWCEGLQKFNGPYLAGNKFTAVDAFYAPVVFRLQTYGIQLSQATMKYAETILGLKSMQNWYASALKEPWIDTAHEQECVANGELLQDFRIKG
jgi:glutathione S-transferase